MSTWINCFAMDVTRMTRLAHWKFYTMAEKYPEYMDRYSIVMERLKMAIPWNASSIWNEDLIWFDRSELLWRCSPWGRKESDTTEQLNSNNKVLSRKIKQVDDRKPSGYYYITISSKERLSLAKISVSYLEKKSGKYRSGKPRKPVRRTSQ